MKRYQPALSLFALLVGASACGDVSSGEISANSAYSVEPSLSALKSAVAACRKELRSCEAAAAGDAAAETACQDTFTTCQDGASTTAAPAVDEAVTNCKDEFSTCREGAQSGADRRACKDVLKSCTAANKGKGGGRPDSTAPDSTDADAAVAEPTDDSDTTGCSTSLQECIEAGGEAKSCAKEVRKCVSETSGKGGGKPDGVGGGKPDGVGA